MFTIKIRTYVQDNHKLEISIKCQTKTFIILIKNNEIDKIKNILNNTETATITVDENFSKENVQQLCKHLKKLQNLKIVGNIQKNFLAYLNIPRLFCKKLHLSQDPNFFSKELKFPHKHFPNAKYITFSSKAFDFSNISISNLQIFQKRQIIGFEFLTLENPFFWQFIKKGKVPQFIYKLSNLQELFIPFPFPINKVTKLNLKNISRLQIKINNKFAIKATQEFYSNAPENLKNLYMTIQCLPKDVESFSSSLIGISNLKKLEELILEIKMIDMNFCQLYDLAVNYNNLNFLKKFPLIFTSKTKEQYSDILIKCVTTSMATIQKKMTIKNNSFESLLKMMFVSSTKIKNYTQDKNLIAYYISQFTKFKKIARQHYQEKGYLQPKFQLNWIKYLNPLCDLMNNPVFQKFQLAFIYTRNSTKNIVPCEKKLSHLFKDYRKRSKLLNEYGDDEKQSAKLMEFKKI
ncbi:MAG: hypothetical protein PVI75_01610 [Gammaproteobacteria bacterium]|jgi:hypothetical protein